MPSPARATQKMKFSYVYRGASCSSTVVHNGTQVQVTTTGGKLLTTGELTDGTIKDVNGVPSCVYTVTVIVPKVSEYYFRASGDRHVYKVSRSTIDETSDGWLVLSTVAVGVVVATWSGSLFGP